MRPSFTSCSIFDKLELLITTVKIQFDKTHLYIKKQKFKLSSFIMVHNFYRLGSNYNRFLLQICSIQYSYLTFDCSIFILNLNLKPTFIEPLKFFPNIRKNVLPVKYPQFTMVYQLFIYIHDVDSYYKSIVFA